jgi:hypothetical protein
MSLFSSFVCAAHYRRQEAMKVDTMSKILECKRALLLGKEAFLDP